MKAYLDLIRNVTKNGRHIQDRTGVGTRSIFGYQMRFDMDEGFPLLTTKKLHLKSIVAELLWFISGATNVGPLKKQGVSIWDEWVKPETAEWGELFTREELIHNAIKEIAKSPSVYIDSSTYFEKMSMDELTTWSRERGLPTRELVDGELGPVYGKQWRDFSGVDQLEAMVRQLTNNPYSRQNVVSAWNPKDLPQMALPPCHFSFQVNVEPRPKSILNQQECDPYPNATNELSLMVNQRSADAFLGTPYNIASYAILLHLIAREVGMKPKTLVWSGGNVHVYNNHLEQVAMQLTREPKPLPTLEIAKGVGLFDATIDDIIVHNYDSHPHIPAPVAV